MNITAIGSGRKKREMAEDIALFAAMKLMPRLRDRLCIDINLIPQLSQKDNVAGDCIWEDRHTRPREFTIRVDSTQPLQTMLETIAHEIVHVKQFARGELQDTNSFNLSKWKGNNINLNKTHYYDLPWEIEAHGRERGLFIRWFEQSHWKKCKWAEY
jgi:hypothetical protein